MDILDFRHTIEVRMIDAGLLPPRSCHSIINKIAGDAIAYAESFHRDIMRRAGELSAPPKSEDGEHV